MSIPLTGYHRKSCRNTEGLTGSTLTANLMFKNMALWSDCGLLGSVVCASMCYTVAFRIMFQPTLWIKGSVFTLALGLLTYFLGLLMYEAQFWVKVFCIRGCD
jgi:hypothetical protein